MTFFCIADKDSSLGFKLCGIPVREVASRAQALEALRVARATKDVGIIVVTHKIAAAIQEEVRTHITENPLPLILEVPSREGKESYQSAGELLKELVGMGI